MESDEFRTFYEQNARPLWAYVHAVTRRADIADDLVQESFLRMLKAPAVHASEAHRKHYLFRIASNLIRDQHRRKQAVPPPAIERDCARATEARDVAEKALAQLSERDRTLVWLGFAEGADTDELAAMTGYRRTTVKVLLSLAKKRMRSAVRALSGEN